MTDSLHQPNCSPVKSSRRSAGEVKKFTVTFDCERVGGEVEFGWTEVVASLESAGTLPRAERLICSGLKLALCPVRSAPSGPAAWDQCPRMQRLAARLGEAILASQPTGDAGQTVA